ncbi:MAG: ABC transporter ATP-binding protein [Chthoniobacteraceae bacterium]
MQTLSETAIEVRGLEKCYRIAQSGRQTPQHSTLAESLLYRARNPFQREKFETFRALQDISFDVRCGEVVGVIGRNGAGKSTLLKILSQITEPTRGEIHLYGRVGSLLEVGTGFHAELTGRENIFLNGAILGMSRKEIARHFDAIVDFAGVGQFLDTPVKRYSSGMYVRLAFAVAAHLSSEILIVDEVLAVGDAEFQRKCLGKMQDVAHSGRTVLFVSHHMQSVSVLCSRAIYLEKGRIKYDGAVPDAIDHYIRSFGKSALDAGDPNLRPGSGECRITSITPAKEYFECGEEKTIRFTIERMRPYTGKLFISCHIVDAYGVTLLQCDSRMTDYWIDATDRRECEFTIRTPWLKPGTYRVDMFLCSAGLLDKFEQAAQIEVLPLLPYATAGNTEATSNGIVFADFGYETSAI